MNEHADTGEPRAVRERFYACTRRRADALFELTDAILTAGVVPSPAHLSLQAVHTARVGEARTPHLSAARSTKRLCEPCSCATS